MHRPSFLGSVLSPLLLRSIESELVSVPLPRQAQRARQRTLHTLHKKAGFTARELQPGYLKPNIIKSRRRRPGDIA